MGDGGPGRGGVLRGAVPRRQLPAGVPPSPGVGTALCQVACRPGCEESITPAVKVINNRQGLGGNLHSSAAGLPRQAITPPQSWAKTDGEWAAEFRGRPLQRPSGDPVQGSCFLCQCRGVSQHPTGGLSAMCPSIMCPDSRIMS